MNATRHEQCFGSWKRLGGNCSQRIKYIFWETIRGEKQKSVEGMHCWAARPGDLGSNIGPEAGGGGREGLGQPVQEWRAGDLSPGMFLGTARVHLALVPPLSIEIKKLIFFYLPMRTRLFL